MGYSKAPEQPQSSARPIYVILTLWRGRGANQPPYALLHRSSLGITLQPLLYRMTWVHNLYLVLDGFSTPQYKDYKSTDGASLNLHPIIMTKLSKVIPQWSLIRALNSLVILVRFAILMQSPTHRPLSAHHCVLVGQGPLPQRTFYFNQPLSAYVHNDKIGRKPAIADDIYHYPE